MRHLCSYNYDLEDNVNDTENVYDIRSEKSIK